MEDYEPVEEENSEEIEQQSDGNDITKAVDTVQLPLEVSKGEIDYYRQLDGDSQLWMQQITPRAGGCLSAERSEHEIEGASMMAIQKDTAHFEVASVPPSREQILEGRGTQNQGEYSDILSQQEASQSEMYQQRSDAEMEIDSHYRQKVDTQAKYFEAE